MLKFFLRYVTLALLIRWIASQDSKKNDGKDKKIINHIDENDPTILYESITIFKNSDGINESSLCNENTTKIIGNYYLEGLEENNPFLKTLNDCPVETIVGNLHIRHTTIEKFTYFPKLENVKGALVITFNRKLTEVTFLEEHVRIQAEERYEFRNNFAYCIKRDKFNTSGYKLFSDCPITGHAYTIYKNCPEGEVKCGLKEDLKFVSIKHIEIYGVDTFYHPSNVEVDFNMLADFSLPFSVTTLDAVIVCDIETDTESSFDQRRTEILDLTSHITAIAKIRLNACQIGELSFVDIFPILEEVLDTEDGIFIKDCQYFYNANFLSTSVFETLFNANVSMIFVNNGNSCFPKSDLAKYPSLLEDDGLGFYEASPNCSKLFSYDEVDISDLSEIATMKDLDLTEVHTQLRCINFSLIDFTDEVLLILKNLTYIKELYIDNCGPFRGFSWMFDHPKIDKLTIRNCGNLTTMFGITSANIPESSIIFEKNPKVCYDRSVLEYMREQGAKIELGDHCDENCSKVELSNTWKDEIPWNCTKILNGLLIRDGAGPERIDDMLGGLYGIRQIFGPVIIYGVQNSVFDGKFPYLRNLEVIELVNANDPEYPYALQIYGANMSRIDMFELWNLKKVTCPHEKYCIVIEAVEGMDEKTIDPNLLSHLNNVSDNKVAFFPIVIPQPETFADRAREPVILIIWILYFSVFVVILVLLPMLAFGLQIDIINDEGKIVDNPIHWIYYDWKYGRYFAPYDSSKDLDDDDELELSTSTLQAMSYQDSLPDQKTQRNEQDWTDPKLQAILPYFLNAPQTARGISPAEPALQQPVNVPTPVPTPLRNRGSQRKKEASKKSKEASKKSKEASKKSRETSKEASKKSRDASKEASKKSKEASKKSKEASKKSKEVLNKVLNSMSKKRNARVEPTQMSMKNGKENESKKNKPKETSIVNENDDFPGMKHEPELE